MVAKALRHWHFVTSGIEFRKFLKFVKGGFFFISMGHTYSVRNRFEDGWNRKGAILLLEVEGVRCKNWKHGRTVQYHDMHVHKEWHRTLFVGHRA